MLGDKDYVNLNKKAERLLRNLREAIDEALADPSSVLAAMCELEDAGFCPSFSVNVTLAEWSGSVSVELVTLDEGLILTQSDESFLQTLGIAGPMA
jgi:hypothetical protein